MQHHEKAFADMRAYYNSITHSNLDIIRRLKEEAGELKHREAATNKLMANVAAENERLVEPLAQVCKI